MDTEQQIINDIQQLHQLSDSEIARLCKTSQPTIWRIRTGDVESCSAELYRSLCLLRKRLARKRAAKSAA